jgi:hypothetical protein
MVGLVISKDFYIDSHFICGVKSLGNIFDLDDMIFNCGDFMCFEHAIKDYAKNLWPTVSIHMWPWEWHDSSLTDEVYIYEMETNRIIYYTNTFSEFFDAKLIRKEQNLQGCEIFDFKFKFPLMFWGNREGANIEEVHTR